MEQHAAEELVQSTAQLSLDGVSGAAVDADEQVRDCQPGPDLIVRGEEGFSSSAFQCAGVAAATSLEHESVPSSSLEPSSCPASGGAVEPSSSQPAPVASRPCSRRRLLPSSRCALTGGISRGAVCGISRGAICGISRSAICGISRGATCGISRGAICNISHDGCHADAH